MLSVVATRCLGRTVRRVLGHRPQGSIARVCSTSQVLQTRCSCPGAACRPAGPAARPQSSPRAASGRASPGSAARYGAKVPLGPAGTVLWFKALCTRDLQLRGTQWSSGPADESAKTTLAVRLLTHSKPSPPVSAFGLARLLWQLFRQASLR